MKEINIYQFNYYFFIIFVFSLFFSFSYLLAKKRELPPNVVVFLIDDLGWKDLGCYGSEFYETPNIDELAKSSLLFTQAYSSHPVCSPTRAAIMTGKSPQRLKITQWIGVESKDKLLEKEITIAETFKENGYLTGYIGKWHLGKSNPPSLHGFEWHRAVAQGGQPTSYYYPFTRKKDYSGYNDVPDLRKASSDSYLTDKLSDLTIEFIKNRKKKHPFFLTVGHYAVHTPIQPPKDPKLKIKYRKKLQLSKENSKERLKTKNSFTRRFQNDINYAMMVENLDANIGRVVDYLKKKKLYKNTIIVFASDNGGLSTYVQSRKSVAPTSNYPLRQGKGWNYEGGIRVPFIVSWPEKIKNGNTPVLTVSTDIYPTLIDMAGLPIKPNQHLDGISLKPILLGNSSSNENNDRSLVWYYPHNHKGSGHLKSSAIRYGNWKLIHYYDSNTSELYNLKEDIGENNNVLNQYSEIGAKLKKQLIDSLDSVKS